MKTLMVFILVFGALAFLVGILYASHVYKNHPEELGDKSRPE